MKFDWWKDIRDVKSKYPLLKEDFDTGRPRLVGEIELLHPGNGKYIDTFRVEITYPEQFPFIFPHVRELDDKIPKTMERHVMPKSGRLCLAITLEEIMLCRSGISTFWFIDRILVPRLAEEYTVNNGGGYSREYSHNPLAARWEFFMNLFETKETDQVIQILDAIVEKKTPKGDKPCFCDSGVTYNKCHRKSVLYIRQLKTETIKGLRDELIENPYTGNDLNNQL